MIRIIPKDQEFFTLFEEAARNILEGAEALKDLLDHFDNVKEKARRIEEIEHRGDTLTHEIIRKLNTSFITPIDREDIHSLACALDDVIDLIHASSLRIMLFKVEEITPQAKELGFLILKSTREIQRAIDRLSTKLDDVHEHCVEVNSLENEADRVCRDAIAYLFEHETDPVKILKWKEIYEKLETATDRCEDAANVLEGVALKNA